MAAPACAGVTGWGESDFLGDLAGAGFHFGWRIDRDPSMAMMETRPRENHARARQAGQTATAAGD